MKFAGVVAASLVLAMNAGLARAQTALTPEAEPYSQCLTSLAGSGARPQYPEGLYARKDGGMVVVEMEFTDPGTAPRVKAIGEEVNADLLDAVKQHAAQLRLPCMKPGGAPIRLLQEFVFVPNDGRKVPWTTRVAREVEAQVLGDALTVSVPCGKVDL